MKPLVMNQRVLRWLSVCPADENDNKRKKNGYIAFSIVIIILIMCGLTSSAVYFFKSLSVNLEECLYSLCQILADLSAFYTIICALLSRQKINAIFTSLSTIYEASEFSMTSF